ncbi:ROK family transcriptional regulator [Curtobacterium sp. MCPF17_001]|uniref:ROK family transcriptional regulator n=1 Tax=Curtobacterium sp. MCPF17_001 TaxID=2175651 RepID=UPI000DA6E4F4|nr:ROK family transcriptional regulator [Curtobacterium sp. MCPF17_001]PZE58780.1 ROK family transcriptional regulator [Curtobacterium sp. MCPF17_001]
MPNETDAQTALGAQLRRPRSKALPQHSRAHNRSLILQTLFTDGAMSRADLSRQSGLTRPTVSGLVAELEADALVTELGPREDLRVGKPATLINLNVDAFHIVVVDLSLPDHFVGAVTNLRGDVVDSAKIEVDGATGEQAVVRIIRLVERLTTMTTRRLLGIAVGCPGVIDAAGTVLHSVALGADLPLQEQLTEHFRLPVHVLNDANTAALGVHAFEVEPGNDLLVVALEHGVGTGMVLGGRLVLGERFAAGEIGHLTIDEDGEACLCGRRGCLEVLIGAEHLTRRIAASPDDRDEVLRSAGSTLGGVLAPIISAVNITEIVVTGPADLVQGPFIQAVRVTATARTLASVGNDLSVTATSTNSDLILRGGAAFLLAAELGVS